MLFEAIPYTNFHDLNLDWIISTIKKLEGDEEEQNTAIAEIKERLTDAEKWIDSFTTDFFTETILSYLKTILATMIFVEINDAGYIVYYIPDGWDEITFNTTGLDIIIDIQPEYGHLVLSY